MDRGLAAALERQLGSRPAGWLALNGGDINLAYRVELEDGRRCFVKAHPSPPPGMFGAEAAGLAWLAEGGGPRIPEVLAASDDGAGEADEGAAPFLALELIETGPRAADHDERLGRELAALHRRGPASFGHCRDNFIAVLPQDNTRHSDWPSFYAQRRLLPQLALARSSGRSTRAMERGFERLLAVLPERCGPPEPPARLHGDLWGGNAMVDSDGNPVLIDPAVHGGHREMDLAMMQLFGGFSRRVFEAYAEAHPLSDGFADRVGLHQLYPLMVHVNLFGGGYARQVEAILSRLG